jgi:outer membrane murein-binding lipoprotein Lpp
MLVASVVMMAGCSSYANRPTMENLTARLVALERERHWLENNQEQLVVELEAAKRRSVELERQVDDLSRNSLTKAKQDLTQARRP